MPLTSNLQHGAFPGNVALPARATGLARDSAAPVSQLVTLDRHPLTERAGRLAPAALQQILGGIDLVPGR